MDNFVGNNSIVRKIWGKSDTVLFIFAGSAAEFALNKAVDWLYFTGRLPSDPLGRLFSTVEYAKKIIFADLASAERAIQSITAIHKNIEGRRGMNIPDWAYRDVLFMLIDYSIRSYELLERKLTDAEKEEIFDVFYRVGKGMGLKDLPSNYSEWTKAREEHLKNNLAKSKYTFDLYRQYRKHLGAVRYRILLEGQLLVAPDTVKDLLQIGRFSLLAPLVIPYKIAKAIHVDGFIKSLFLPPAYKAEIRALDKVA